MSCPVPGMHAQNFIYTIIDLEHLKGYASTRIVKTVTV